MDNNENKELCRKCGGQCCKHGAGGWFPGDLPPITEELLNDMLDNGYQFDWWEGNPTKEEKHNDKTAYYLRPQHTNSIGKVRNPSWGGQCVFLGDSGCTKTWKDRPTQCKALQPNVEEPGTGCYWEDRYGKREIAEAWLPYNDIIEKVIKVRHGRPSI